MVGCLSNLYESIEVLSKEYIQPNQSKDHLLKPKASRQVPLFSLNDVTTGTSTTTGVNKYYVCSNETNNSYGDDSDECEDDSDSFSHLYVTHTYGTACPECGDQMVTELAYVGDHAVKRKAAPSVGEGGFVKGVVTYIVMDNLVVQPMSTISGINLLSKFNVKDIASLEEKVVDLDMAKGLKLLKASLQTNMVLTSVFLNSIYGGVNC